MESDSSSSCGEWSYFPGIIPHLGAWSKKENIDSSLKEKLLCQKQSFFVVEHGKCFMFNVILRKQCKGRHIIVSQGHFSGDTIVFFLTSRGQRAQLKYVDREQISSLTTSSGMCSKQSAVTGHNFRRHIPGLQALNDSCVHSNGHISKCIFCKAEIITPKKKILNRPTHNLFEVRITCPQ